MRKICLILAMLLTGACVSVSTQKVQNVLIIGDSISLAYTPKVKQLLAGKAIVQHNEGNAGPTLRGVEHIDHWLGDHKWDVIHFNWGLWDMYRWNYEQFDQSPQAYEKNLDALVQRLQKTGAKLIWGTTTPACALPEKKIKIQVTPQMQAEYMAAAKRVMHKYGVTVNDLHAVILADWPKYKIADDDVHFNRQGSEALAEQVAEAIESALSD